MKNGLKRETVYNSLKKQIFSGYILPGSRLVEMDLARDFGMSRTTIREVIKEIAAEGLIEIIPHKGAKVTKMSLKDMEDTYRIQQDLEGLVALLASERLSDKQIRKLEEIHESSKKYGIGDPKVWVKWNQRFHSVFTRNCGNERLIKAIENNHNYEFGRYRYMVVAMPGSIEKFIGDHERILAATKKRRPTEVRMMMEKHIERITKMVLELLCVAEDRY